MPKTPQNHGKTWTGPQKTQLRELARGNTPTRLIALKTERTESAIRNKASELGLSLKPPNQPPYNRRPKG